MGPQEVLLDTFVARLKEAAALSRGDRVQVENYAEKVHALTSGEYGHFTAAATGESLALTVIAQVVDYSTGELVVDVLVGEPLTPGYAGKRLLEYVGAVLDRELTPTLGAIPNATKKMICDEVLVIAMDACRGRNSKAAMLWEAAEREAKSSMLRQVLDTHASWVGKLLAEIVKSVGR